jgi:hypothetical protein
MQLRIGTSLRCLCGVALLAACTSDAPTTGGDVSPASPGPGAPGGRGEGPPAAPAPGTPGGGGETPKTPETPETPETPIPYVHFDVNHVISTGQSNSVAHEGRPILSTTQPLANLMFNVGVMTAGDCDGEGCRVYQKPSSFVPLVEGDTFWWGVETMSSGLANEGARLATTKYGKPAHDILVSLAGRNGLTYWCLRKGRCYHDPSYVNAYAENMMQVTDAKAIAAAAGKSYVVRMVTAIHGESDDFGYATNNQEFPNDGSDGTPQSLASYADALIEWQRDYEAGVKAITGQAQPVPLLISQFSGWNDAPTSRVTQLQYDAHVRAPGKVVLVAPAYTLDWAGDCRHYTSHGERRLGEYFGKAYARIVVEGRRWEPLRPSKVTRAGNVITAKFLVPVPPLVLDTTLVTDPGAYGFEVVDDAGTPVAVTNVALAGPDTVTLTLAGAPSGKGRLRYAFTHEPHTCPGATRGPRGNLRDSDTTPSNHGYSLFNWAVHFEVPIQ